MKLAVTSRLRKERRQGGLPRKRISSSRRRTHLDVEGKAWGFRRNGALRLWLGVVEPHLSLMLQHDWKHVFLPGVIVGLLGLYPKPGLRAGGRHGPPNLTHARRARWSIGRPGHRGPQWKNRRDRRPWSGKRRSSTRPPELYRASGADRYARAPWLALRAGWATGAGHRDAGPCFARHRERISDARGRVYDGPVAWRR